MARLLDGELEEVRSRSDIISIVSEYIRLKKTGRNYTGLCPFHKEKTPSFSVDPARQLFHCFGCGEGGDVFSFIQKIDNLDFNEAVVRLAERAGYKLRYAESWQPGAADDSKRKLYEINRLAMVEYKKTLSSSLGEKALEYLKKRGFSEETLRSFDVGFAPEGWDFISSKMINSGYRNRELLSTGLVVQSERSRRGFYDRFRNRITFPITDLMGNVVGFGGRAIDDQMPKYINSPETVIYKKGNVLYNLFRAKEHIIKNDMAYVVEGYTDVIALAQVGIANCVASLGTALTIEQVRLLARFTPNISLVFDADVAGGEATKRGLDMLKEYNQSIDVYAENNINIFAITLPPGKDPADIAIEDGREAVLDVFGSPSPIMEYSIDILLAGYDLGNSAERIKASKAVSMFISSINSRLTQEEMVKILSSRLKIKEDVLAFDVMSRVKQGAVGAADQRDGTPAGEFAETSEQKLEKQVLHLIAINFEEAREILLKLDHKMFTCEPYRRLFIFFKEYFSDDREKDLNQAFTRIVDESQKKLLNGLLFDEKMYDNRLICREVEILIKELDVKRQINYMNERMIECKQQGKIEELDGVFLRLIELEKTRIKIREDIERIYQWEKS
ncbi:MAG: DNA primase [Actinobacteria bacterium]|nr:DNA primase [Actinomycetota bacterium]